MSQERTHRSRAKRYGVEFEEEKVWVGYYRRVVDPAVAVEVMSQLESDPDMKRTHLALYLRCKESLRTQKARQARNKRIGQFVRMLFNAVFVVPVIAMRRLLLRSGDLAVECLPEVSKEPATRRVGQLSKKAEFEQAKTTFTAQTEAQCVQENDGAPPASKVA